MSLMDKIMRIWVFACMLLFAMRQFLPDLDKRFNVLELYAIVFALLLTGIAGVTVYNRVKEGRARSVRSRS